MPTFRRDHPFYAEALTYATTQVCMTFAHYLRGGQSLPLKNFILNRGRIVDSILRNTDEVLVALGTRDVPSQLVYDEADASGVHAGQRAPDYKVPPEAWNMISQVCIGSAFERVIRELRSHYGGDPWMWPRELEYFYHVRNGCFHGNAFAPRPRNHRKTAIDPLHPPSWRTSVLADDASIRGKAVLGGVLASGACPSCLAISPSDFARTVFFRRSETASALRKRRGNTIWVRSVGLAQRNPPPAFAVGPVSLHPSYHHVCCHRRRVAFALP